MRGAWKLLVTTPSLNTLLDSYVSTQRLLIYDNVTFKYCNFFCMHTTVTL